MRSEQVRDKVRIQITEYQSKTVIGLWHSQQYLLYSALETGEDNSNRSLLLVFTIAKKISLN